MKIQDDSSKFVRFWSYVKMHRETIIPIAIISLASIGLLVGIIGLICALRASSKSAQADQQHSVHVLADHIAERAYASGQVDAMHGDVRIKILSDSTVIYVKSPWDDCHPTGDTARCVIPETLHIERSK